jgi:phosphoketolase
MGAYQLQVCREVGERLREKSIGCRITYLLEPGRFRIPRDRHEQSFVSSSSQQALLFNDAIRLRVFVSHMRPEVLLGVCRPLDLGRDGCLAFGYRNRGGTLDTQGLLQANGCDAQSIVHVINHRLNGGRMHE